MSRLNLGDSLILDTDYSESEVKTGATWIDGKPIYRKVYTFTFNSTNSMIQISLGLNNVKIIKFTGLVNLQNLNGNFFPINFYYATDNYVTAYVGGDGRLVILSTNSATASQSGNVIIEYIKTTD